MLLSSFKLFSTRSFELVSGSSSSAGKPNVLSNSITWSASFSRWICFSFLSFSALSLNRTFFTSAVLLKKKSSSLKPKELMAFFMFSGTSAQMAALGPTCGVGATFALALPASFLDLPCNNTQASISTLALSVSSWKASALPPSLSGCLERESLRYDDRTSDEFHLATSALMREVSQDSANILFEGSSTFGNKMLLKYSKALWTFAFSNPGKASFPSAFSGEDAHDSDFAAQAVKSFSPPSFSYHASNSSANSSGLPMCCVPCSASSCFSVASSMATFAR
mmetsp:Transcript_107899/g.168600  ORF Transcript_107899/g.168600 Transcript_107899/m.168600 type:complete len:280 (+) Transcript_107899:377-1216(+)